MTFAQLSYLLASIAGALLVTAAGPDGAPNPPEGMVYVPAGPFIMGSNVGDTDESPQQIATTKAYFVDIVEVTNDEYKKLDPAWTFKEDRGHFPVIVTWNQATAYAKRAGKRLPTEVEWEKA
ncbi:unnamed protein product, partial [marine sediment metagenome]